jgi:hypothetical protein
MYAAPALSQPAGIAPAVVWQVKQNVRTSVAFEVPSDAPSSSEIDAAFPRFEPWGL